MNASYSNVNACDELIVAEETEGSSKLLTILVDSLALLGLLTIELNALRRDLMKHNFPGHLKQLVKKFHQIPPIYLVMTSKNE